MAPDSESEDKPAEIVDGPPPPARPVQDRKRSFFHPLSGLVILGVDWLAFGLDLPTEFLFMPLVCVLAFGVTFWAVARIQLRDGDDLKRAYLKAFLGGLAAGAPFPVAGTIVGTAILLLSGLPRGSLWRR
jgi:hypothetical protein